MNGVDDNAPRARPVTQWPEPARCWVAFAPRTWRLCEQIWTNLASGELSGFKKAAVETGVPDLDTEGLDDFLYLPAVDPSLENARLELAASLAEQEVPVLLQRFPGDKAAPNVVNVYDLLPALLDAEPERLAVLPKGALAVWPMIPGISDYPECWDEGLDSLEVAGVSCVQPLMLDLPPLIRRKLAEGRSEDVFDALFHVQHDGRRQRAFSSFAHKRGFEVFMPRPVTGAVAPRVRSNRRIAEQLALAGELWLRLGRAVGAGQALLRAARGAESTHHDLAALAREKNLRVIDWFDGRARDIVTEWAEEERSGRVERLLGQYLNVIEDDGGAADA
ncbi:MAG: hypothetical protein AAF725_25965, partial [Acidobacteriota bacterium]